MLAAIKETTANPATHIRTKRKGKEEEEGEQNACAHTVWGGGGGRGKTAVALDGAAVSHRFPHAQLKLLVFAL